MLFSKSEKKEKTVEIPSSEILETAKKILDDYSTYKHNIHSKFLSIKKDLRGVKNGMLETLISFIDTELNDNNEIKNLSKTYQNAETLLKSQIDDKKIKKFKNIFRTELMNLHNVIQINLSKLDSILTIILFYERKDLNEDIKNTIGNLYKDKILKLSHPIKLAEATKKQFEKNIEEVKSQPSRIKKEIENIINKQSNLTSKNTTLNDINFILDDIRDQIGLINEEKIKNYEKFKSQFNHKEIIIKCLKKYKKEYTLNLSRIRNIEESLKNDTMINQIFSLIFDFLIQTQQTYYHAVKKDELLQYKNPKEFEKERQLILNTLSSVKLYLIEKILTHQEKEEFLNLRNDLTESLPKLEHLEDTQPIDHIHQGAVK